MPLVLAGATSGSTTIQATDAVTQTITLPNATGTVLTTNGSGIASVNGIQFPATQSPSADANTLDDYEEGTFTPAWSYTTPGTLSVGYSSRSGTYTKIGDMVYFRLTMIINSFSKGTASGNPIVTGMPFSAANTSRNNPPVCLYTYSAPKNTTAGYQSSPWLAQAESVIYMQDFGNNTTIVNYADPNGSSNEYYISGCYKAT
jgi:hypothetical protein